VGQRSAGESVAAIFQAFLAKRSWSQADLAREVGVLVPALKKQLAALENQGLPLLREEDHPHVYWSVPKHWFPGGVVFHGADLSLLLRYLARAPRSKDRDRLIASTTRTLAAGPAAVELSEVVEPVEEAKHLSRIEDSATQRVSLHCRYVSSKGREGWRHLSVQRIVVGPPARFVAVCHRTDRLKWFRVDNVLDADLEHSQPFRKASRRDVDALVESSLDGFADTGSVLALSFLVRSPEAGWVAKNLLGGMVAECVDDGIRVVVTTSALPIVARFVVGLGEAARCETPALAVAVETLARGALAALPGP